MGEEGLNTVTNERRISSITITLSKEQLDTHGVGYQPPLTEEERAVAIGTIKKQRKSPSENETKGESSTDETGSSGENTNKTKKNRNRRGKRRRGVRRGRGKGVVSPAESSDDNRDESEGTPRGKRGKGRKRGSGRGRRGRRGKRGGKSESPLSPKTTALKQHPPGAPGDTPPPIVGKQRPPVE